MADEQPSSLLTLRELALRWGLTDRATIAHVKRIRLPFIQFGKQDRLINRWLNVRFRPADIEEWERNAHVVTAAEPDKASRGAKGPAKPKHKFIKIR